MKTTSILACSLFALILVGCGRPAPRTTIADKKTMTMADVKQAVEGKTPREVIKSLGKPSSTNNTPDDLDDPKYGGSWTYPELVVDPANGKTVFVFVRFREGKATAAER